MSRRNKHYIKKQIEQFKKFLSMVIYYPRNSVKEFYGEKPTGTVIMSILLVVFSITTIFLFSKMAWAPYVRTWSGVVIKKDTKINNTGQSQIATYMIEVERLINKKRVRAEHVIDKISYLNISQADSVYKPFLYSRVIKSDGSRDMAKQLQDFTIIFMSIFLFLFTIISGNSFIAVLFVSLFLYEPKKYKNKKKK